MKYGGKVVGCCCSGVVGRRTLSLMRSLRSHVSNWFHMECRLAPGERCQVEAGQEALRCPSATFSCCSSGFTGWVLVITGAWRQHAPRCLQRASLLVKLTQEILARRRPLDSKPGYSIWWAATPGVQRNALMHAYLPRTPSTALLKQIYPSYLIRKEPLRFCCCLNGSRFPPHNWGFFIFNR